GRPPGGPAHPHPHRPDPRPPARAGDLARALPGRGADPGAGGRRVGRGWRRPGLTAPGPVGSIARMSPAVRALRGATTVDTDTAVEIEGRTVELLEEMFGRNGVDHDDLISIWFTVT